MKKLNAFIVKSEVAIPQQPLVLVWVVLLSLLLPGRNLAQAEMQVLPYTPAEMESLEASGVPQYLHDASLVRFLNIGGLIDESTLRAVSPAGFRLDSIDYVLSLTTNPYAPAAELVDKNYEAGLRFKLIYFSADGGLDSTAHQWLHIDYDALGHTTYRSKDYFVLKNKPYVRLKVDSAYVLDRNTGLMATDLLPYDQLFQLRQNLTTYRTYQPNPTEIPQVPAAYLMNNSATLQLSWKPVQWATSYDLEWTFVDDYPADPADPPLAHTRLGFDFAHNSTRVNLGTNRYELPLVFDRGYVLFRVRAVGSWGTHPPQRIEGDWTAPDKGTAIPHSASGLLPYVFYVDNNLVHEDATLSWQHQVNFFENGKRKDAVQYLDGTSRQRQLTSRLNTENKLLISETIYDHQGRPAVNILPAPFKPESPAIPGTPPTTSPGLQFVPGFNLNTSGLPYSRSDFDLQSADCVPTAEPAAAALHTVSGAGNYYSTENPAQAGAQGFVPDAEGYPFRVIQYTDDHTGRVSREGGLGPALQLGNGHDSRFFYVSPSQTELDRMFGNDAGNAAHYGKTVALDVNGQAKVSYEDPRGNVVATALAGESPANLTALDNQQSQSIRIDVIELDNELDPVSNSLFSSKSIYISGEPGTLVPVDLEYEFSQTSFKPADCPSLCYSCVYDLRIELRKDCGDPALAPEYSHSVRLGSIDDLLACTDLTALIAPDTGPLQLEPGKYFITKKLTVNNEAIEAALADYLSSCPAPEITEEPAGDCTPVCIPCEKNELYLGDTELTYRAGGRLTLPVIFKALIGEDCQEYCFQERPNGLETAYLAMLGDVSPGGQYGEYFDTTRSAEHPEGIFNPTAFPVSVYNDRSNHLPLQDANWQHPVGGFRNRDGSESWIEIPLLDDGALDSLFFQDTATVQIMDGVAKVRPQALKRVRDFINNWRPSWAHALVYYHPEYMYYRWGLDYFQAFTNDLLIQSATTYLQAMGLSSAGASLTDGDYLNDFAGDSFLDGPAGARTAYEDLAREFLLKEDGDPDLLRDYNIVEAAVIATHCGLSTLSPADLDNCQATVSLYGSGVAEVMDVEWQTYRSFALDMKQRVLSRFREQWIQDHGYPGNYLIGEDILPAFLLVNYFAEKNKRFPGPSDFENFYPDENGDDFTDDPEVFRQYYRRRQLEGCGLCESLFDLSVLLQSVASAGKLDEEINYPTLPPLVFPAELLDHFSVSGVANIQWIPNLISDRHLEINLLADGRLLTVIELQSAELPLLDTLYLSCFQTIDNQTFQATGFNTALDSTAIIGRVSHLQLNQCDPQPLCKQDTHGDDMLFFFDGLFQDHEYLSTNYLFYNFGPFRPLGRDMVQTLRAQNVVQAYWQFRSWNVADRSFNAHIRATGGGYAYTLNFTIASTDPTKRLSDVARFTAIIQPPGAPPVGVPSIFDFILLAETATGETFEVRVTTDNTWFPTFFCKLIANDFDSGAFCCIRPVKVQPGPDCASILDDVAEGNRRLRETNLEIERAGQFRSAYIAHCLAAAEALTLSYEEKLYQFTLYYYDRANNLVKAVPPKDVRLLNDSQLAAVSSARSTGSSMVYPTHRMATAYTYNSLDKLLSSTAPDAGGTTFCYDELGRMILMQDAVQAAAGKAAYVIYDNYGRVQESGTITISAVDLPHTIDYATYLSNWLTGTKTEIFRNHYDSPLAGTEDLFLHNDRHLRNRKASMTYRERDRAGFDHATHYDYDIAGNIRTLVQDFAKLELQSPGTGRKTVSYDYDQISGNIKRMLYQAGQEDQFIHWYFYDADNRLNQVKTATLAEEPADLRDLEIRYRYYEHGPLARMELGQERVQGLDFAFTLQSWIKGLNSATLFPDRDMGRDGDISGPNRQFAQDAYGFDISYFDADYTSIHTIAPRDHFYTQLALSPLPGSDFAGLFDGSLRTMVNAHYGFDSRPVQLQAFRYDQLHRLKNTRYLQLPDLNNNTWLDPVFGNSYASTYSYDPNGNILQLSRRDATGSSLDELTYQYQNPAVSNRLRRIDDSQVTSYPLDLEDQDGTNYAYDQKGRLRRDLASGINRLQWRSDDRLSSIQQAGERISFEYDAQSRRVWKEDSEKATFYVRDDVGNILSVYELTDTGTRWKYAPLYAQGRIGTYSPNRLLAVAVDSSSTQMRGQKQYELGNHIGSVQTLVSDRKVPIHLGTDYFAPDVLQASDYYPFGMLMPERQLTDTAYGYGFHGFEADHELKGAGNAYSTAFRLYDPRVGRWLSPDPVLKEHESPYAAFSNAPMNFMDSDGLDTISMHQFRLRALEAIGNIATAVPDFAELSVEDRSALIAEVLYRRYGHISIREESPESSGTVSQISTVSGYLGRLNDFVISPYMRELDRARDVAVMAASLRARRAYMSSVTRRPGRSTRTRAVRAETERRARMAREAVDARYTRRMTMLSRASRAIEGLGHISDFLSIADAAERGDVEALIDIGIGMVVPPLGVFMAWMERSHAGDSGWINGHFYPNIHEIQQALAEFDRIQSREYTERVAPLRATARGYDLRTRRRMERAAGLR